MKNIKLLHRFLLLFNIALAAMLLATLVFLVIPDLIYWKQYDHKVFGPFNHLVDFMRGALLFIALWKAQQGLAALMQQGFYNRISELKFKSSGVFLIILAISSAIFNIFIMGEIELNFFITNFMQYFFILLAGIGLHIFSDFIKSGKVLKEDTDLTI